ncbi:GH116 family glycosyl hydrolase [Paenibacillus solisilvae]|uniref:GH116 family glycosyl hydrolase n=1 Tax=Paenibacillus solisilvae TaxID=2486751 RepID=A0ABW0VZ72_9BACL
MNQKRYNGVYKSSRNSHVAFPLGGIGAGMFCLEGTGAMSHFSLHHRPDTTNEPIVFSAISVKGRDGVIARVLEGPVPKRKIFSSRSKDSNGPGNGLYGKHYGLPRFKESRFQARFPFGTAELRDPKVPVAVTISGWSPFIPLNANDSSLPAAGLEFTFANLTDQPLELVYSYHAAHFMAAEGANNQRVLRADSENGFVLDQPPIADQPWKRGAFSAVTDHLQAKVDCAWFRGGWFDSLTMVWNAVESGQWRENPPVDNGAPSPGASIYVPLQLLPHERQTVRLMLSWFVPESNLNVGIPASSQQEGADRVHAAPLYHKPWYAGRFEDISAVSAYWTRSYARLREESCAFTDSFYGTTMPAAAVEAAAANLSILKSPTVLRQIDGRFWGWEGSEDTRGSCHGTCTHVWNYAQALPHLFPELERSIRATEFEEGQDERGHQNFRVPLPIQPADHDFHAAADGQLGGIMKVYREWRISGDIGWLRAIWPKAKQSLRFCMETWDPDGTGVLAEPHHNTYDIEFWGPDGMCSSIYLGALKAASRMAEACDDNADVYETVYRRGRDYLENELFNGEYFEQKIKWEGLRAPSPTTGKQAWNVNYSSEAAALMKEQGPKYQYGQGCLSDGVIGAWLTEMCGLGDILDRAKVRSHLLSVYTYNLKRDLSEHANPQRPGFALGNEGGLLLCTWPKGGRLALPFVYSNEVWTGIEYQVASHLISLGCVEEGLEIVQTCRDRYDGSARNPFNEYECGHWYARAMASYGLLQGWSGIRYDACERTLYMSPKAAGDYSSFLCTASGYGIAGMKGGMPFVDVKSGQIAIEHINLE